MVVYWVYCIVVMIQGPGRNGALLTPDRIFEELPKDYQSVANLSYLNSGREALWGRTRMERGEKMYESGFVSLLEPMKNGEFQRYAAYQIPSSPFYGQDTRPERLYSVFSQDKQRRENDVSYIIIWQGATKSLCDCPDFAERNAKARMGDTYFPCKHIIAVHYFIVGAQNIDE